MKNTDEGLRPLTHSERGALLTLDTLSPRIGRIGDYVVVLEGSYVSAIGDYGREEYGTTYWCPEVALAVAEFLLNGAADPADILKEI